MFKSGLIEYFFELKSTVRHWRLVGLVCLMLSMMVASFEDNGIRVLQFYFTIWTFAIIKPKVNRLNYLLPSDSKIRALNLLVKNLGATLFILLWYFLVYAINVMLGGYHIKDALQKLLCDIYPIVILFASYSLLSSYDMKGVKTNLRSNIIIGVVMIFATLHIVLFSQTLTGVWYVISTIAAYFNMVLFNVLPTKSGYQLREYIKTDKKSIYLRNKEAAILNIIFSSNSNLAIYEQIINQIKLAIINKEITPGEALPSIRGLAKDLQISVITTKRAYEELEHEGLIYSVTGKGFYVCEQNTDMLMEKKLAMLEQQIAEVVRDCRAVGLEAKDVKDIIDMLYQDIE